MGIIQILILATQFGFEKNLNFLAIFCHFGHCGGEGALSNVVGIGLTDLPKSGLHVPSLAPTALRQVNDPRKNSSPEYSPLENC